jgi:hypothetical protein
LYNVEESSVGFRQFKGKMLHALLAACMKVNDVSCQSMGLWQSFLPYNSIGRKEKVLMMIILSVT